MIMNMITFSESGTLKPYLPIVIPFVIADLILLALAGNTSSTGSDVKTMLKANIAAAIFFKLCFM